MKKFLVLTALVIILLPFREVKPQDPIDLYDGIPLVIYPDLRVVDIDTMYTSPYQQMEDMGVFGVVAGDVLDNSIYLQHFTDHNLKVIPQYVWGDDMTKSHILRYTDAHYTVWEAEGTDPAKGNATLSYDNQTSYFSEQYQGETIEGRSAGGFSGPVEIISGPGYPQNIKYRFFDNALVQYFGEYRMKITERDPDLPLEYLNDVVCTLKVTALDAQGITEFTVATKEVTVAEFNGWDNWRPIQVDDDGYNFRNLPVNYQQQNNGANQESPVFNASYIQFKVIWTGLPYLNLFVDRIIVYDEKGWQLKNISQPTTQITTLVNTYITDPTIVGWYGLDEPQSIDNYEPYRVVDSIVNSTSDGSLRLHTGFTAGYQGRYGDLGTGAHPLFPAEEFWLRAKPKNVQINMYNYNYPYASNPGHLDYDPLWRTKNIEYVTDYYLDRINDFDTNFAFSTQSGKFGSSVSSESIIPSPSQINYHVNLGLMYGAKELRLDPFFSDATRDLVGLINIDGEETENYYFFKNLLIPRLNGLFGQTLRQIHQMAQYPNINPSVSSDLNINAIKKIKLDYENVTEAMPSYLDLGFFSKEGFEPNRYFMIINRYYSDSLLNKFKIDFRNLSGFYNWSLMNYVDSSHTTIIANETGFVTSPQFQINRGDAILFSLFPVAEFGGKLLVSENVGDGMTLTGDMTIENGATLFIYDTYYAKANITVKAGGKIISGENAKIIFDPGKKLIIEGSAEIKGTSATNKLTLQFSGNDNAVIVKPGSSLTMDYCNITGAYQGIVTETGARSYINITNTNISAAYCGVSLISSSSSEELTSQIYNCSISSNLYGISVSNYNLILIMENIITGCAINISNSASAFLQGNVITGGGSSTTYGIFMSSSTGYVRSNTITNCLNGIHLANSSPDVGGNILQGNVKHGLFIGSGSIPNLVAHLQLNPPLYFPLSGYNKIYSNGSITNSNPLDNYDGSEIYLANSGILLSNGCNQISDDRQSTPTMNTLKLICGSLYNSGKSLNAIYNYWGTTTPTASRFSGFSVVFSPYYTENCPLPDGGSGGEETLVLKTSTGLVVDSIYAADGVPENYTDLQVTYSEADNLFATGNVTPAKPLYEQIVSGNHTAEEKLPAYNKLYAIGNLTGEDENYFNNLQSTFEDIANNEADTLIKKVYSQNAIKCDVSKEEYLTAISKFDNIIQQNPNSEEAIYAEIDIITTALNLDTTNSQLGKMGNGKYLVKGTSDYLSRLNDILQSKFGVNSEEKEQIIPKEYSLYQNYPNPFNPVTTIKFDLPNDGIITLEIFDILGRRIATLADDYKTAGRYEQVFNASSLASGVYVYKLQAGGFISSKKMILLK